MAKDHPSKNQDAGSGETAAQQPRAGQPHAAGDEGRGQGAAKYDRAAAEQMAADLASAEDRQANKQFDQLESSLESLRAELRTAEDRALRSQAELENYRKRIARQMDDERRYANLPLMRDLLPVLDNIQRAIEAAEKTHDTASLLQGIKIVAQQLEDALARHHCRQIDAMNVAFDPHLHEAIAQQPSMSQPPGTVILVTQSGFRLHDRVVRPSQVIVAAEGQPDGQNDTQE